MKIKYFQDTDTLHIEFRAAEVAETKGVYQGNQLGGLDSVQAQFKRLESNPDLST